MNAIAPRLVALRTTPKKRHEKYMALVDYETALRADAAYSPPVRAKELRALADCVRTQIHSFVGQWRGHALVKQLRAAKW